MKFLLLILLTTSSFASDKVIFNTIAEVSGIESAMGGKAYTKANNIICQVNDDVKKVQCKLIDTSGKNIVLSDEEAISFFEILYKENALAYSAAGAGSAWFEAKEIKCLGTSTYSEEDGISSFYKCDLL